MIIIDTNVVSELMRPRDSIDRRVSNWVNSTANLTFATTILSFAEHLYGVERLPDGARKFALRRTVDAVYQRLFSDRILTFDRRAAEQYVAITIDRRRRGLPMAEFDSQIAAIAKAHDLPIATRDRDFDGAGLTVINPWEYAGP